MSSNRIARRLGIGEIALEPPEPTEPLTPTGALIKAFNEGTITTEQLREVYGLGAGEGWTTAAEPEPETALALIHERLGATLAVCGVRDPAGLALSSAPPLVTCPDCVRVRGLMKRRVERVLPGKGPWPPVPTGGGGGGGGGGGIHMTVSGGSGVSWTEPEPVFDDHPVIVTAEQIDPEIIGKIGMIETIDDHLTVTADRVAEMAENLKALQKAMEALQEARDEPATAVSPPEAPTPSSDLREDILAVLEEFGHDPEVAAEIIAERCRAEAPEDAPGPAALPERYPTIVKATADAMTTEDRLLVNEAIERGDSEVTPEGYLRVAAHNPDGDPSEWIFTEEGWRWADARTAKANVDLEVLTEEMWRTNLDTLGTGYVALSSVSQSMQDRYRAMADRLASTMLDPDRTFLR